MQQGKTALIKKDGGEIAIVLDRPIAETKALVNDPEAFIEKLQRSCKTNTHPVIAQMIHPDVRDDLPPSECATGSSGSRSSRMEAMQYPARSQTNFQ